MVYEEAAKNFVKELPYKISPYDSRNWGNDWHSLCSYHGKLKPAIAHFLVSEFTEPGEIVLDPLCGVGTIPFEASLQGRIGVGNDLSELAYVVSKAKLERPSFEAVRKVLIDLQENIETGKDDFTGAEYSDFGFNGKLPSYFHPETYKEILCARRYFLNRFVNMSSAEAMVFSALLHVLHGNRPYALSRHSHPLTPYAPKGSFEYKSVIEKITQKIGLNYTAEGFEIFTKGKALYGHYNHLSKKNIRADCIICSPPFADSIRFYMNNWMRLWLCGWESYNYKIADSIFIDNIQTKDFDIYNSFFDMCSNVLNKDGKVILHLGKTKKIDMAKELSLRAEKWFDVVYSAGECVNMIEKHGIKDKGATVEHQFLFLKKV